MRRRTRGLAVTATIALALPLAACASEQGPPVLSWYTNPDAGGQAEIAQRCTEAAGGAYRIETSVLPRDAASQREQLARRLAARDASIDIMSLTRRSSPSSRSPASWHPSRPRSPPR